MITVALLLALRHEQVDPQKIFAQVAAKLKSVRTISMSVVVNGRESFTVRALRPNLYRVESPKQLFLSDGGTTVMFMKERNEFLKGIAPAGGMRIPLAEGLVPFSPPRTFKPDYSKALVTKFGGRAAYALVTEPKEMPGLSITTFFDKTTMLPLGGEQRTTNEVTVMVYRDLMLDKPMRPEEFTWSPPAGARDLAAKTATASPLLKVGDDAPDVIVQLLSGKQAKLSDLRASKKALIVSFWFINCGYCMVEMPHLQELYRDLRSKGLELLAVNDVDSSGDMKTFVKKTGYTFPFASDTGSAVAKSFRAAGMGYPILYVIDSNGKITYVQHGFDPAAGLAGLKRTLEELGVS